MPTVTETKEDPQVGEGEVVARQAWPASESRRTRMAPLAYSESLMPALRLARSSRIAKRTAQGILAGLLIATLLMALAPWQQSVTGSGNVVAFAPAERQQVIESPIKGRVVRWGDGIAENARVTKGQLIVEIADLDEAYSGRLEDQLENSDQQVAAAHAQLQASQRAREAAIAIVESLRSQRDAYIKVKEAVILAQDAYVDMAQKKVAAEEQQLIEYQAALPQLEAEFERTRLLHGEGNIALQKLQEVERKLGEGRAKVKRAESYVAAAQAELAGKTRERQAKVDKAQIDVDYATASLDKGMGDISKSDSDIAKAQQDLNKAEKDRLEAQIKVARQESQSITAPFDGFIVQITSNMRTAVLKEGDPVCTIVPETSDRAVQLWVDGNDAPLIEPGRHVRLQFEGWPAVQFAGWPSIAVGTFGGEVISVDAIDNGLGKFRILVQPDPQSQAWPAGRFLRQGVRANGWVLLNRVPLWFECWRQLNGFPPVVSVNMSDKEAKNKPPKLPK